MPVQQADGIALTMTSERNPRDRRYPTKAKVRQFVEAARDLRIAVSGFEVTPEGVIRVFSAQAFRKEKATDDAYDKWFRENP